MANGQLAGRMWAEACAAVERAERLHRQFFHHAGAHWQAPVDVFETRDGLIVLVALPGVEPEHINVVLSAGVLVVRGERLLPGDVQTSRILRMEIPHGYFERRIELPAEPFEVSGRHLANGCLMLRLQRLSR
jgi:HSP20 family protein